MSPPSEKFSVPAYSPDEEQIENLKKLLEILDDSAISAALERTEILRELSRFVEAEEAINLINEDESTEFHLVRKLITERNNAPHRYRL